MSISRRQFAAISGAAALATALPGRARAQQPMVIKFSHVVTDDTPKGKASLRFKELAEKYTGGKVKIEVYPNSQLYKDKEEIEALQLGAVQMLAPSTAKFAPLGAKEFEAMDLPYVFADDATYDKIVKGEVGTYLMAKLKPAGISGLAFWDNGFHMVSANKPLLMPADFQGLKIRISGSKIADMYFRKLGAQPQIMAFSEVYQALQTGVVDGCENTPSNYTTQRFDEVQKHITNSQHAHLQYAVIVTTPLRVAQVVFAHYESGAHWNPQALSPGMAVLELLLHCIPVQRDPRRVMSTLTAMVAGATAWSSARGEADAVAHTLLQSLAPPREFESGTLRQKGALV